MLHFYAFRKHSSSINIYYPIVGTVFVHVGNIKKGKYWYYTLLCVFMGFSGGLQTFSTGDICFLWKIKMVWRCVCLNKRTTPPRPPLLSLIPRPLNFSAWRLPILTRQIFSDSYFRPEKYLSRGIQTERNHLDCGLKYFFAARDSTWTGNLWVVGSWQRSFRLYLLSPVIRIQSIWRHWTCLASQWQCL